MVNNRLTRGRSWWRNVFDRVVWRREKGSGARTGIAQPKTKRPVSRPDRYLKYLKPPNLGGFIRHGSGIGIDISLVGFGRFRLGAAARAPGALRSRTSRQSVLPARFPRLGRQPEVKWPAAPPCRPLPIALPQVERWPAQIQTGKPRQVPSENRDRLYDRPAPQTRMAGTECGLKRRLSRKGIAAWKIFFFLYCRAASARW